MTHRLDASIAESGEIECRLAVTGEGAAGAILCLSMIAPVAKARGAEILAATGPYLEIRPADPLEAGTAARFALAYPSGFRAANRAWLPIGAYLRHPDGRAEAVELSWPQGILPAAEFPDAAPAGLGLTPPPTKWSPAGGVSDMSAVNPSGDAFADVFRDVDALAGRLGLPPLTAPEGAPLAIARDGSLAPESYRLTLAPEGSTLAARDESGAFHGAISLLWLRAVHSGRPPSGAIDDAPRFAWRGQHLDCARHFFGVDAILRLLDVMALLKLNRFHWHFADDEAFRLELDAFPDLFRTVLRGEGASLPALFGGGPGPSGGSYSGRDVGAILERARSLHVEVLPEIEFPAHALCLTRLMPGLRDPDDVGTERSVQGYEGNVMNPAMDATWDFVLPLSEAVAEKFPFAHLHVGGDELPAGCWEGSPAVARLKRDLGLVSTRDVQGWAMERLARHLRERGVAVCAWEEAARGRQGGIGNDAVVFSWTGRGPGLDAARSGHPVVMCPARNCYLDMAHSGEVDDWGASWAAVVGLRDTVDWDPVPEDEPNLEERIIGVQGAFWGEFTTDDRQFEAMLLPRLLGIASRAWSPRGSVSGADAEALARAASPLLRRSGWRLGPIA